MAAMITMDATGVRLSVERNLTWIRIRVVHRSRSINHLIGIVSLAGVVVLIVILILILVAIVRLSRIVLALPIVARCIRILFQCFRNWRIEFDESAARRSDDDLLFDVVEFLLDGWPTDLVATCLHLAAIVRTGVVSAVALAIALVVNELLAPVSIIAVRIGRVARLAVGVWLIVVTVIVGTILIDSVRGWDHHMRLVQSRRGRNDNTRLVDR